MQKKWWGIAGFTISFINLVGLLYVSTQQCPTDSFLSQNKQCLVQGFGSIHWQPMTFGFLFLFGFLAGLTIPVALYLNQRFAQPYWFEQDNTRLARQALWVGVLGLLMAYLQLMRALNWATLLVLISVFVLIETFILTRD
ncbi:hypothetical protein QUF58_11865 [Anaerolineales bacterium HSG24]|nr:hypothetical protein [Anaerolineales bacterium HSG24]